jgi:hypothetical protein
LLGCSGATCRDPASNPLIDFPLDPPRSATRNLDSPWKSAAPLKAMYL